MTSAAVNEVVRFGEDRRSWLFFCSGVAHAEHIRDAVRSREITCECIFGNTPREERDAIVADFKAGKIRALAAMNVLTTGFNAPAVDLIAMLRPPKSTGLYVQIAGRGTRLAPGKENCLVLDFAGNVARHGPIDLVTPKIKEVGGDGTAPTRACPACKTILPVAVRKCTQCGHEFPPPEVKIEATATTQAILSTRLPKWVKVYDIAYKRHQKPGKPPSMRVEYLCGFNWHKEWVCFEHEGYARQKAEMWWRKRAPSDMPIPSSVDEALKLVDALPMPDEIAIRLDDRFVEVMGARFNRKEPDHGRSDTA